MKKVNIIAGFVFMLFSFCIFIGAMSFKQTLIVDSGLGADFFPKVVSIITLILSGSLIYSSYKNKTLGSNIKEVFNSDMKKPLLGMFLIIIYAICINIIGYLVSTIVFCYIFLQIFKVKKKITKILVSLIFSSIIYYIFSNLFMINLPQGLLL